MLRHFPGQLARGHIQEVQVVFKLVEHVADDIHLIVTEHIVGTATTTQEHLGAAILMGIAHLGLAAAVGIFRHRRGNQADVIDKAHMLIAVHHQLGTDKLLVEIHRRIPTGLA